MPVRRARARRLSAAWVLCGAVFLTAPACASADPLHDVRVAADWAIGTGNAAALADLIAHARRRGARLDPDDPFSVGDLVVSLRALDGGPALADAIEATRGRGQIGGAPRRDFRLPPGARHSERLRLAANETAFVGARLKRGSGAGDIDLLLFDAAGAVLARDTGPETGTGDIGALVTHFPEACVEVEVEVRNAGAAPAEVALLVPQSLRQNC